MFDKFKGLFQKRKTPSADDYFANAANWKGVSSSNIASISYFLSVEKNVESVLGIRFKDGSEYHYFGVPLRVFSSFMAASSKGRFGHQQIYNVYRTEGPF